jgi:hypothetical protein
MRRPLLFCLALSAGCCALAVEPAFAAPTDDPFESAPVASPPKPKPAPRPRPAPEPEPVVATPPPAPAPPRAPFDGIWTGTFACDQTRFKAALTFNLIMEIKNGNWSRLNVVTTTPGQPGYDHYEGSIGADGHVLLTRTGVGNGQAPGGAALGEAISMKLAGAFQGDAFTATAIDARRACRIQLTRLP